MTTVRHGVWLLSRAKPLSDSRYWRKDEYGSPLPTPFSRALGIRAGQDGLCFRGVFGELSHTRPLASGLLRGLFGDSLAGVRMMLPSGVVASRLRTASAFAVLAAPGLRLRTVSGLADLVAIALVRPQDEP
jgi:hypothetical protein